MAESDFVVALDLGTTKICALVGEIGPDNSLRLVGVGQCPSEGLRKGVVIDIAAASKNIREAVDIAGRSAGLDISSVVVGVTGEHVASMNSRGSTLITHASREITDHDVHRVMESARSVAVPSGREVLHVLPRGFAVDGQTGVRRPVGMSGARLEVETHIITASSSFIQNVFKSVEGAGLAVDSMVLEPVATSEAVLTQAEKELGVLVIDIGGGTSDVAVVIDGSIIHSVVFPVGGNHVTNDLAVGLKTSRLEAERLKKDYGCALVSLVADDDLLDVATVDGMAQRSISRRAIADIIEPRMQELYQLIAADLEREGLNNRISSVVLSGGGGLLHGAPELGQAILELPVRVGRPRNITPEDVALDSPVYATAVGLLRYGAANHVSPTREASTQHFVLNVLDLIRQWVTRLFPG